MLKPEQVPDKVARDAAYAFYNAVGPTVVDDWKTAIAAALNAWPGVGIEVARDESEDIILPLPQEDNG